jgi:hypothetical protein
MRQLPDALLTTLSAKVLSRLLFTVSTGFSDGIQLAIVFNKTEIKLLVFAKLIFKHLNFSFQVLVRFQSRTGFHTAFFFDDFPSLPFKFQYILNFFGIVCKILMHPSPVKNQQEKGGTHEKIFHFTTFLWRSEDRVQMSMLLRIDDKDEHSFQQYLRDLSYRLLLVF